MGESKTHKILKQIALRWIQGNGCVAFACEVRWGFVGIVDAVGIKANGDVYIVEAKASNADMKADSARKKHRTPKLYRLEHSSRIDFVYYIIADGVDIENVPAFIGILNESGSVKRKARRRERAKTKEIMLVDFRRIAMSASWRAYGHVIRHEQEQMELSLF